MLPTIFGHITRQFKLPLTKRPARVHKPYEPYKLYEPYEPQSFAPATGI